MACVMTTDRPVSRGVTEHGIRCHDFLRATVSSSHVLLLSCFFCPLLFLFLLSVLRFFLSLFSTLGLFFW